MPAVRDILGHVSAESAVRERKCTRNKAKKENIAAGELCLVVKSGPMNSPQSYCVEHAQPMLDGAWKKLRGIYAFLKLKPPSAS
jgi:hypothetical protein